MKRCLQLYTLWWHHRGCLLALEHDLATSILIPNTIVLLTLHIPVVCMRQEGDMSTRTALLCLDMSAPSRLQSQRTADYDDFFPCQIITGMPHAITTWYGCV